MADGKKKAVATAYVQVVPTVDGIKGTLEKELGGEASKAVGDIFKGTLTSGFVLEAAKKIGAAILDIGGDAIEAAAEVRAANAQFEQTFGELEGTATAALRAVSDETGIAATRLKSGYTALYAFTKSVGGDTATALNIAQRAMNAAADSAAYYDRTVEEATETLMSFMKGNYANDAALGIAATETTRNAKANELYARSFQELTEAQKVDVLLSMVEAGNKASGALGNAAREAQEWTNVTGELSEAWKQILASLGSPVLEAVTPMLRGITDVLKELTTQSPYQSLMQQTGEFREEIAGAKAELDASSTSMAATAGLAQQYANRLRELEAAGLDTADSQREYRQTVELLSLMELVGRGQELQEAAAAAAGSAEVAAECADEAQTVLLAVNIANKEAKTAQAGAEAAAENAQGAQFAAQSAQAEAKKDAARSEDAAERAEAAAQRAENAQGGGGSGGGISQESDPTVPTWAKQAEPPVSSVNGRAGAVQLGAPDVGAEPVGAAASAVAAHNTSTAAHSDLRQELAQVNARLTAFFDSDDQTLDELSEIVAYITSNKSLIEAITTSKVSVADIVNNLTTNVVNKPLSAAQGVVLKGLVDGVSANLANYQPKGNYLTEHQDISHLLPREELSEAVDEALAAAKESGEFDGAAGQRGTGILKVTTAPSSYTTTTAGVTPIKRMSLSTIKSQAGVEEVLEGDLIAYSYYQYHVYYLDGTYAYMDTYVSVRGAAGDDGDAATIEITGVEALAYGAAPTVAEVSGSTAQARKYVLGIPAGKPGADYVLTDDDRAQIAALVIEDLGGRPVYGYVEEDTKSIILHAPEGAYTYYYQMADGTLVEIGKAGADAPEEPDEPGQGYTNLIPISTNADGSLFVGTNGEAGYKPNTRVRMSNGEEGSASGIECTGFMPVKHGQTLYIKGITIAKNTSDAMEGICFYNANREFMVGTVMAYCFGNVSGEVASWKVSSSSLNNLNDDVAYVRMSSTVIGPESIVTVDELLE